MENWLLKFKRRYGLANRKINASSAKSLEYEAELAIEYLYLFYLS